MREVPRKSGWASREWVDLRESSLAKWQERLRRIRREADRTANDTSPRFDRPAYLWKRDDEGKILLDPGELVAWVLINEYRGGRRMPA